MANNTVTDRLRGLVLSAVELKDLTTWPDPVIEDYLSLVENLQQLAQVADNNLLKSVSEITAASSPYTPSALVEEIFLDTTLGEIVVNLPVGIEGTHYRLINVGTADNKVTVTPNGTELLFAENVSEYIYDEEALIITFNETYGWH